MTLPAGNLLELHSALLAGLPAKAIPVLKLQTQLSDAHLAEVLPISGRPPARSLALRAPSIHSETDANLLLHPLHSRAAKLSLIASRPYRFDPRLFNS